jgi:arylsulfatase A-like enzyme
VTLAEALKSAGYATFFAGKWHLGGGGFSPEDQGFDVNKGGYFRGAPTGYFSPYGNPKLSDGPEGEHLPARLAEETVSFIRDQEGEPFFAMLSFYSVHTPLQTRADLEEKYKRKALALDQNSAKFGREGTRKVRLIQDHAVYAGMVEAMDLAVGTVLDALEDLNLATNTIIFFTSDNGGLSTSEGGPTSNLPLRAGKGWLYEGGIREPTLIRWPGKTGAGLVIDAPVMSTDFYPTILDMTGTTLLPSQHIDGVSLAPLLRGDGALPERALYWHYPHYGNQGSLPSAAIREGPYKLISFYEDDRIELYNLDEDVGEQVNLAAKLPDKAKALQGKLHDWQEALDAKVPSINPKAASN